LLEDQVAALGKELESLSRKASDLDAILSATEFSLIRQKIGLELSSGLVGPSTLALRKELDSRKVLRARSERPLEKFLIFIEGAIEKLPESDRPIARKVVASFVKHCNYYIGLTIDIPDLGPTSKNVAIDWEALTLQILRIESAIERCFLSVMPQDP
jgi:hypothetical protein